MLLVTFWVFGTV